MKKIFIIMFLLACWQCMSAQKETYWWTFGNQNSFNFNLPVTVNDSKGKETIGMPTVGTSELTNTEGCFTLSNSKGELMMYGNGRTIWDRTHTPMPNGITGIDFETYTEGTQSGIIVPYPGSPGKYYVLSIGHKGVTESWNIEEGLISYSVVDMSLNGGTGDVIPALKDQILWTTENDEFNNNIAAIKKKGSDNYWIIHRHLAAPAYTNAIMTMTVWELTPAGFSAPVTYDLDTGDWGQRSSLGYLKFSSDGRRFISLGTDNSSITYVFSGEFDPETGLVSDLKATYMYKCLPYGIEFSLSGEELFISYLPSAAIATKRYLGHFTWDKLRSLGTVSDELVPTPFASNHYVVCIQMHSDGRIYGIEANTRNVYVIMDPEEGAEAEIRVFKNYLLKDHVANYGLPTFAATFMAMEGDLLFCTNTSGEFTMAISSYIGAMEVAYTQWDFGDGSAPIRVTGSGTQKQSHVYTHPGKYTVTVSAFSAADNLLQSKTLDLKVHPCILPVNPNVHLSNN